MERRPEVEGRAPAGRERSVAAVVLAGGSGLRIGQGRNKAYLPLAGQTAVGLSLRTMVGLPGLRRLLLVVREDDVNLAERTLEEELPHPPVPVELVLGGSTRHGSEERALQHLAAAVATGEVDLVLIHDAARPLCSTNLVTELLEAAAEHGGAVPGLAADDLARIDEDGNLTPLTGDHVRVQTPQAFVAAPLLEAYRRAAEVGFDGTDTSACVERFSLMRVQHVTGEQQNFKITYPQDLYAAESFVREVASGRSDDAALHDRPSVSPVPDGAAAQRDLSRQCTRVGVVFGLRRDAAPGPGQAVGGLRPRLRAASYPQAGPDAAPGPAAPHLVRFPLPAARAGEQASGGTRGVGGAGAHEPGGRR